MTLRTLARPYAVAAFESAVQSHHLKEWSVFLQILSEALKDKKVRRLVQMPLVSNAQKVEFLISIVDKQMDAKRKNFLEVLAYYKRLILLLEIYKLYEDLRLKFEKTKAVELVCAQPPEKEYQKKFEETLTAHLGQPVALTVTVEPALLGGALVRVGDSVIDGSLRGQLQKMKERLLA